SRGQLITIDAFIAPTSHYQLEPTVQELERRRSTENGLSTLEIARRWDVIARHSKWLATHPDEGEQQGAPLDWHLEHAVQRMEFGDGAGDGGLQGVGQGAANLQVLRGLGEGLQQLQI